jgi:hypothetical protein
MKGWSPAWHNPKTRPLNLLPHHSLVNGNGEPLAHKLTFQHIIPTGASLLLLYHSTTLQLSQQTHYHYAGRGECYKFFVD